MVAEYAGSEKQFGGKTIGLGLSVHGHYNDGALFWFRQDQATAATI